MLKQDLIEKSPVRILERGIEGGLKAGNIGIIASRKGIGKTSVLVQLALDKLLRGQKVVHVSFTTQTSYVVSWYENIFTELARKKNLENLAEMHDDIVKNRVIMNFIQEGFAIDQVVKSLSAMIDDGGFKAQSVIIDGFDFTRANPAQLKAVRKFAKDKGVEVWFSCTMVGEDPLTDKSNVPVILRDYMEDVSVLILLEPRVEYIHFIVVKDHERLNPEDLHIKLDSRTLLIAET